MHSRRRLAALTALAIAVGVAAFYAIRYLRELGVGNPTPMRAKLAAAEELVCYELSTDRSLRVRVQPTDTEYRVISHLLVPTVNASAPAPEYLYGIAARLLDEQGIVVQEATYWASSKATKVVDASGGSAWEAAFFYPPRGSMPTDGRTTTVLIPATPTVATLELTLVSSGPDTGIVRLYNRVRRDGSAQRGAWRQLRKAEREELARHNVYTPSMLTYAEKMALTEYTWERTAAEGNPGRDFTIVRAYVALPESQPLGVRAAEGWDGVTTAPDRHTVINVRGPGAVRLRGNPTVEDPVEIEWVRAGSDARIERGGLVIASGAASSDITIPAGEHTVTFAAAASMALQFYAMRDGRSTRVEPEARVVAMYLGQSRASDAAIEADISANALSGGVVRIRSRALAPSSEGAEGLTYSVRYTMLDARGVVVSSGMYNVDSALAPETYVDERLDVVPTASHAYDFAIPPSAATLRVTAADNVAFALYASAPGERVIEVADAVPAPVVRQDCAASPREWFYFRPTSYDALAEADRRVLLRYQCRHWRAVSDPYDVDVESPVRLARAVAPVVSHGKVVLLERTPEEDVSTVGSDSTFYEWGPGVEAVVTVADTVNPENLAPTPVSLVARGAAGTLLPDVLRIDGRPALRSSAIRQDGIWTLPHVERGARAFSLTDGAGLLYINRRPAGSQRVNEWRKRTCYRLFEDGPVYVIVDKKPGRRASLNCVVYAREPVARGISVDTLHGPSGAPAVAEVKYAIANWQETETFAPSSDAPYPYRATFRPRVAAEMPPGQYVLRIALSEGVEVASRFVVMDDASVVVGPEDPAVVNLVGPGTLTIEANAPAQPHIATLAASGARGSAIESITPSRPVRMAIPTGLVTVQAETDGTRASLRMLLEGPTATVAGRYLLSPNERPTPLPTDTVRQTYYRASAFDPARLAVEAGDTVRVGVRGRPSGYAGSHAVQFWMATGGVSGRMDVPTEGRSSAAVVSGTPGEISPETYAYIRPPKSGILRVWADGADTLIRFAKLTDGASPVSYVRADEDEAVVDASVSTFSRWSRIEPTNAERLLHARDIVTVVTPRRRVDAARTRPDRPRVWKWLSLQPEQPSTRVGVLEEADLSLRETAYAVGSAYFQIRQGAPVELDTHALAGDVRVAYSRADSSPATLAVRVDGVVYLSQPLTDASGIVALYGLPAGQPLVSVEVEPSAPSATLWITHVRDGSSRRGRMRRTYDALSESRTTVYRAVKSSNSAMSVNVAGYLCAPGSAPQLTVNVRPVGQRVATATGSLGRTDLSRRYVFDLAASGISNSVVVSPGAAWNLRPMPGVVIPLGTDLRAGDYAIEVQFAGARQALLRLFVADDAPSAVARGGESVVNVIGPGTLLVDADGMLDIEQLTSVGAPRRSRAGDAGPVGIPLARGPLTVYLRNTEKRAVGLRLALSDPAAMDPSRGWPARARQGDWQPIYPQVTAQSYASAVDGEMELSLSPPYDGSTCLRLTLRTSAGEPTADGTTKVCYTFSDAQGSHLAGGSFAIGWEPDPLASYPHEGGYGERPSLASVWYLRPPVAAVRLVLRSSGLLHARAHTRSDNAPVLSNVPGARDSGGASVEVVAPTTRTIWAPLPIADANHGATPIQLARPYVRTRQPAPDREGARGVSLSPENPMEAFRLVEFVGEARAADTTPTTYAAVPFDEDVLINVVNHDAPDTSVPTAVRLLYGVGSEASRPASPIRLWLDAAPLASYTPLTAIGRMVTPDIATGRHMLRIERLSGAPDGRSVAYMDQTPMLTMDARMLRLRTVHLLDGGAPMTLRAPKQSSESVTLNIVVTPVGIKGQPAEDVTVRAVVGSAVTGGASTGYTPLTRQYSVSAEPSDSVFLDAAIYNPSQSRTCLFPLREDLPAGEHAVRVELRGSGSAAVRFFVLTEQPGSDRVRAWRVSAEQGAMR